MVLLAKNAHVHALLTELQEQGSIQKTYEALVYGGPEADSGSIHAPIARRPLPSLLRYVNQDGKPSHTEYRVLQRLGGYSRLSLAPVTGRTHQLRVHCAYIGCPILGDPQYGTPESLALSQKMGFTHQYLCAVTLIFPHPITGHPMTIHTRLNDING